LQASNAPQGRAAFRPGVSGGSFDLCKSARFTYGSGSRFRPGGGKRGCSQWTKTMKPEVEIYDTTLRDGSQGEGINFSVADKLRIAERLDAFGVHYIEGGWPGSNPKDIEFFEQAKGRRFTRARLAAFGSTRRKKTPVERDEQVRLLLNAESPVVTIFGKTWLLHVREVLQTTPEENLAMIADTVRFLKEHGKFVVYDAEHCFDGYKNEPDYALATLKAAEQAGADIVTLCDTNGGCLPGEIREITAFARKALAARIGIHTHDDIGLGVANALAGLEAGATHIQGTINGYGERTGNCNLTSVIPNVALKLRLRSVPEESLAKLKELSQFVDEIANIRPDPRQPWVGSTAFAHKGGMHVNAVQKLPQSFEHIDPGAVGNSRRVLISDLAGRSNIVMKARELGFDLSNDTPELKPILESIKELEHLGYEFEAAEGSLALLIRRKLRHESQPFVVESYHVSMRRDGRDSVCEAAVKVKVGAETAHTVAEGDGPVNALDSALRLALSKFFGHLAAVRLTDYKVRILDSGTGTAARTRVLIQSTDGNEEWGTVGVSGNIIEASLQALVDSMEYRLWKGEASR
jgi:2-isopropylmalate synthase